MMLFVEVVKAHSFRRAAEIMNMPSSTLSRRISDLERAIGLRLMNRTTRRLELTEAGSVYFERCSRLIDEAKLAHEQLDDLLNVPKGLLRISLPVDFATVYLSPLIADFAQLYPDIHFDLNLTARHADLVAEPYDLAIRMGQQPDSGLVARLLVNIPRYLFASPLYLSRIGTPRKPEDLLQHECLRMGTPQENRSWHLHSGDLSYSLPLSGKFSVNNMGMLRSLALRHQGVAALSEAPVTKDLEDGHLVRVLPEWELTPVQAYAITSTRLVPAKTQRFIDYMSSALQQKFNTQAPDSLK